MAERTPAFLEIISSEESFVKDLKSFLDCFISPLYVRDTPFKRQILEDPYIAACFNLLVDIHSACESFVEAMLTCHSADDVAHAFTQFAPALLIFSQFLAELTSALNGLAKFGKALSDYTQGCLPSGTAESHLVSVQEHYSGYRARIAAFVKMNEMTSKDGGSVDKLVASLSVVEKHCDMVDAKIEEENVKVQLLLLQQQFKGNANIFKPNRRFLHESDVERVKAKESSKGDKLIAKPYYLHLFNDTLIMSTFSSTQRLLGRMVFTFAKAMDLECSAVEPLGELAGTAIHGIKITNIGGDRGVAADAGDGEFKTVMLQWPTAAAAAEWMGLILDAQAELASTKVFREAQAAANSSGGNRAGGARASMRLAAEAGTGPLPYKIMCEGEEVTAAQLTTRTALLYYFLKTEYSYMQELTTLSRIMVTALLDSTKGAALAVNTAESNKKQNESLRKQRRGSTFTIIQGRAENRETNYIREQLQNADMQIFLRATENIAKQSVEFIQGLEDIGTASKWTDSMMVGPFFNSIVVANILKQFENYVSGQLAAVRILSGPAFSKFIEEVGLELGSRNVTARLETPKEGPVRYLDLLKKLLDQTPANHPDVPALKDAIARMENHVDSNAEIIRQKLNFEKLVTIQAGFVAVAYQDPVITNLVSMDRKFLRVGDLKKVCRKENKLYRWWLFNDYLMYATVNFGGTYSLNRAIPLDSCTVNKHTSTAVRNAFDVHSTEKSFTVICNSGEERDTWMRDISDTVAAHRKAKGITGALTAAPVWVSDKHSDECFICSSKFTMFKRKHHCRACGLVVCDDHSSGRMVLANVHATDKQRVCDTCYANPPSLTKQLEVAAPTTADGVTATASPTKTTKAAVPAFVMANPMGASGRPSSMPFTAPPLPPGPAALGAGVPPPLPSCPPPPVPPGAPGMGQSAIPFSAPAPAPAPVPVPAAEPVVEEAPRPAGENGGGFLGAIGDGGFKLRPTPRPVEHAGEKLGRVTDPNPNPDPSPAASAPDADVAAPAEMLAEEPVPRPLMPMGGGGFLGDIGAGGFKLRSTPKKEDGAPAGSSADALPRTVSSRLTAASVAAAPKLSFLDEIQKGNAGLKKASPFAPLPKPSNNSGGLMGLLANKMAMRRCTVKDESDDESVRSGFSSDSD